MDSMLKGFILLVLGVFISISLDQLDEAPCLLKIIGGTMFTNIYHSAAFVAQRLGSCYLEVSFGTTGLQRAARQSGVTWCYLALPGVLPSVTWAPPRLWFGGVFILFRVPQTQTFGKRCIFTSRCYLGPRTSDRIIIKNVLNWTSKTGVPRL